MSDSPIEKIHIQEFLSLVEGLEVIDFGRQSPPEPDFWAETNLGLIGIEHTRLFKKVDQNGVDPVLHEKEADEIANLANILFQERSNQKVHVSLSFRLDYGLVRPMKPPLWLKKSERKKLATEIVDFVLKNIPEDEKFTDFENPHCWTGDYFLPEIISSVSIGHYSKMAHSFFGIRSYHFSPTLENGSRIFQVIEKKNRLHGNFKKEYFQTWLVMVTSPFSITMDFNFYSSELPSIKSPFERVFIYRHGDQKFHELQKGSR